ncbi:MAG: ABC transporter substrate-binding protein, partial [Alphaproteobacteria bacterium]|nr:ABC transporter substrate-binding protein [Alphaproteobacteria bacterium]
MKTGHNRLTLSLLSAAVLLFGVASASPARAAEPIKIGTGMALTGGLAASGKAAILAMKIWEEEINAKGGLLGRPVQLVYYDDQSNPATVPGIFTKLLDVDKVDLICGDYGTNLLAPAMPVVIQHNMTFFALFGLDVNREFQYPRYFAMQPAGGPNPSAAFSQGFFEVAAAQ